MLSFTKVIESSTTCTWFFEKIITFYYTSPIYFLFAAHVSSFLFLHMKSILRSSSSFLSCVTDNIFLLFYSFLVTSNFFSLFPSFYGSSHSRKSLLTVWTWKFPDLRDFSERARQLIFNLLYGFYDARHSNCAVFRGLEKTYIFISSRQFLVSMIPESQEKLFMSVFLALSNSFWLHWYRGLCLSTIGFGVSVSTNQNDWKLFSWKSLQTLPYMDTYFRPGSTAQTLFCGRRVNSCPCIVRLIANLSKFIGKYNQFNQIHWWFNKIN